MRKPRSTGRPKKSDADRKDDAVRVRLTADQREKFERAARAMGMDVSTWMRWICEMIVDRRMVAELILKAVKENQ